MLASKIWILRVSFGGILSSELVVGRFRHPFEDAVAYLEHGEVVVSEHDLEVQKLGGEEGKEGAELFDSQTLINIVQKYFGLDDLKKYRRRMRR